MEGIRLTRLRPSKDAPSSGRTRATRDVESELDTAIHIQNARLEKAHAESERLARENARLMELVERLIRLGRDRQKVSRERDDIARRVESAAEELRIEREKSATLERETETLRTRNRAAEERIAELERALVRPPSPASPRPTEPEAPAHPSHPPSVRTKPPEPVSTQSILDLLRDEIRELARMSGAQEAVRPIVQSDAVAALGERVEQGVMVQSMLRQEVDRLETRTRTRNVETGETEVLRGRIAGLENDIYSILLREEKTQRELESTRARLQEMLAEKTSPHGPSLAP